MPTVLPFDRVVVRDRAFTAEPFSVHTRWIETEFENTIEPWSGPAPGQEDGQPPRERITVEVGGKRLVWNAYHRVARPFADAQAELGNAEEPLPQRGRDDGHDQDDRDREASMRIS